MKKKILLFLLMFTFITNVSALTFDVNVTNIEDEGNNGTIGRITNIDLTNKEVSAFFQDIGDEINFSITVTNSGDRAGTLREITFGEPNNNFEYTSNLPDGGLAINGNDTNTVIIKAKVKEGAQNGKTTSEVKIKYTYDEGSCPDGEILSDDESMCLCPEGMERNEKGVCVKPDKKIECKSDEIYNEQKNQCEKKVVPVTPDNPKTLDNIILVTLLFFVSGLGIYAVLFRRLKTSKQRKTVGVVVGVITLSVSFTVLAAVFGLDNLLSAIINPITKSKELVITVNEEIELIETWDGVCDLDANNLTPSNIFEGGSGTESDPYQIKTAEQLSCFAKSVNNGTTYAGKFIKQTKNIKLNDKLLENLEAGETSGLNVWTPIGSTTAAMPFTVINSFNGTYDGDDHIISGVYIDSPSLSNIGFFSVISGATVKNLWLSDNYVKGDKYVATLVGYAENKSLIDNVKTYGKVEGTTYVAGIAAYGGGASDAADQDRITNSENYADVTSHTFAVGIAYTFYNIINSKNYGNVTAVENAGGIGGYNTYIIDCENHGEIKAESYAAGLTPTPAYAFNSDNYGNILGRTIDGTSQSQSGYVGLIAVGEAFDCNNYGDIDTNIGSYPAGVGYASASIYKSGNTGTITMHDNDNFSGWAMYITGIYAAGAREISDESISGNSAIQTYKAIMGKDFAAENQYSYNSGDFYVTNVNAGTVGINVAAIANSGSSPAINAHNTGSIYISNSSASGGYITMIGADGSQTTNCSSEGDIIIDNYTNNDLEMVGIAISGSSSTNSYYEGTIEVKNSTLGNASYPTNSGTFIAGGTTAGGYMTNSYAKGNIKIHDNDFVNGAQIGGLTASGAGAEKSYSEVEVEIYGNTGTGLIAATLATSGGRGVTDSYNKGNINIHDNSFNSLYASCAATGGMGFYGGNYNAGNLYVKDNYATTMQLSGGTMSGPWINNYYNLGNITFETENNTRLTSLTVGGINTIVQSQATNIVNAGNITIPYVSSITNLSVGGLYAVHTDPRVAQAYSIGTITIADGYTYSENINYGNLYGTKTSDYNPIGATPGAFYTQDGYAMGLSRLGSSYSQFDANYGTKINASSVPNILEIINVNGAFEIKEGETLPTLKVFN